MKWIQHENVSVVNTAGSKQEKLSWEMAATDDDIELMKSMLSNRKVSCSRIDKIVTQKIKYRGTRK